MTAQSPLERVVAEAGIDQLVEVLADRLPGSDLTTLLLEVMRRRASQRTPPEVLRQVSGDRFTRPSTLDGRWLHAVEAAVLGAVPVSFEMVVLSPVVPLGTHSALATVDQHKVVSTIRQSEVAADPTNALALEAAQRRRHDRSATTRLAAVQRVVRAQRMTGGIPHFSLCGLVTAGRDAGSHRVEMDSLCEHLGALVAMTAAAGGEDVEIAVTDLGAGIGDAVAGAVGPAIVRADPDRTAGRGYYLDACFKLWATVGGRRLELADGGFVDWTRALLSDAKERLLISGLGLDRLVPATPGTSTG